MQVEADLVSMQVRATAPFHAENSAWAPPSNRERRRRDFKALFFNCLDQNMGKHANQDVLW